MHISVRGITKRFGAFLALDDLNLDVPSGQLLALLGPSGSGKTTLLRVIAGLEIPDEGEVHFGAEDMTHRSVRARNVGFVFQHYALFRELTIYENVAFGMEIRNRSKSEIRERVRELLEIVGMSGLENRLPSQLSGGQRQRISLARALAIEPKILLLDEPFGALDAKVRAELRHWLRELHDRIKMTTVFVTHDQEEAFEVADEVVLMRDGRIEQQGSPIAVFQRPINPFVMDFLGNVNKVNGIVENGRVLIGGIEIECSEYTSEVPRQATVYLRPHDLEIVRVTGLLPGFPAEVRLINSLGTINKVYAYSKELDATIRIDLSHDRLVSLDIAPNEKVFIVPSRVHIHVPID